MPDETTENTNENEVEEETSLNENDISGSDFIRLLHIDSDNEDEIANALLYKAAAEEYLTGAGVAKDYSSALYKQLVILLTARALERPDGMSKFADIKESGFVAMTEQLRRTQKQVIIDAEQLGDTLQEG